MKRINKHVYTWVGTFLFGLIGVDKFMRGKTKQGILKLLTFGLCLLIPGVRDIGLWGVWALIDWIIALVKLGQYENDFTFFYGDWSDDGTKKEILRKQQQEKEAEEREQREKERIEKYKKDVLSGAISYDEELKKIKKIEDEFSEYKSYFKEKTSEAVSLMKEYTNQTRTGNWDTTWYSRTVDKIKNIEIKSFYCPGLLADLLEIKWNSRISDLKMEIEKYYDEWRDFSSNLRSYQNLFK